MPSLNGIFRGMGSHSANCIVAVQNIQLSARLTAAAALGNRAGLALRLCEALTGTKYMALKS